MHLSKTLINLHLKGRCVMYITIILGTDTGAAVLYFNREQNLPICINTNRETALTYLCQSKTILIMFNAFCLFCKVTLQLFSV